MRGRRKKSFLVLIVLIICNFSACFQQKEEPITLEKKVKRVGMVIGIKPEKIAEYKTLHADENPGVRDLLTTAHMENFSIFLHQFDNGKYYLFGYYEYTGADFEADMAKLAAEQRNIEWLKICDPMQIPLKEETTWSVMEQVYYNK
jgi:L-rhamnose mutarotase